MNGQIELYGFTIEWWATKAFDDGFDWKVVNSSADDVAVLMDEYYGDVDAAVRKEFDEAVVEQAVEDMIDQAERAAMFGGAV